jgi:hypothetical protein
MEVIVDPLIIGIIVVVVIIAGLVALGITVRGGEDDLSDDVEVVDDPELTDPETEIVDGEEEASA